MKMKMPLVAMFCVLPFAAFAQDAAKPQAKPVTLPEAFKEALAQSETIAEQGETVNFYEARITEMEAAFRPRVSFAASQLWQDTSAGQDDPTGSSPTSKPQAGIVFHHSLFSGMRDMLALKASKSQGDAAKLAYARARQLLYQNVAQAYLNLLSVQDELAIRQSQIDINKQLITELKSREKIGRSRQSEVLAAQSQLAQDEASLANALGRERVAQWTLRFLTGMDADAQPAALAPVARTSITDYLIKAHSRPDVEQARRNLDYSEIFTESQKNQKLPTAAFDADYYLKRPQATTQHVYWDATFSVSVPLYLGGVVDAQVAEADASRRLAEQALHLALRQADLDVHSAHDNMISSLFITDSFQNALAAAQANAQAQKADYRYGLVTNLDVLTSQTAVENTRLQLEQAQISAQLAKVQLEVAAGMVE